jgi:hypothetical protein
MKKVLLPFLFFLQLSMIFCQQTDITNDTKDRLNTSNMQVGPGSLIYGFDSKKGEIIGDNYLDVHWQEAIVILYPVDGRKKTDTIQAIPVRLNLYENELEFKTQFGIKALPCKEVKKLSFGSVNDVSAAVFLNKGELKRQQLGVLYQVMSSGKVTLLLEHKLWVKGPTYHAALDVGSRNTEFIKQKIWHYQVGSKLEKFKPTKSKVVKIMKSKAGLIEQFLEKRPLDMNDPATLQAVFDYFNSL